MLNALLACSFAFRSYLPFFILFVLTLAKYTTTMNLLTAVMALLASARIACAYPGYYDCKGSKWIAGNGFNRMGIGKFTDGGDENCVITVRESVEAGASVEVTITSKTSLATKLVVEGDKKGTLSLQKGTSSCRYRSGKTKTANYKWKAPSADPGTVTTFYALCGGSYARKMYTAQAKTATIAADATDAPTTNEPTASPTTKEPTPNGETGAPTKIPTAAPSAKPTTKSPTDSPKPTGLPTSSPTFAPTVTVVPLDKSKAVQLPELIKGVRVFHSPKDTDSGTFTVLVEVDAPDGPTYVGFGIAGSSKDLPMDGGLAVIGGKKDPGDSNAEPVGLFTIFPYKEPFAERKAEQVKNGAFSYDAGKQILSLQFDSSEDTLPLSGSEQHIILAHGSPSSSGDEFFEHRIEDSAHFLYDWESSSIVTAAPTTSAPTSPGKIEAGLKGASIAYSPVPVDVGGVERVDESVVIEVNSGEGPTWISIGLSGGDGGNAMINAPALVVGKREGDIKDGKPIGVEDFGVGLYTLDPYNEPNAKPFETLSASDQALLDSVDFSYDSASQKTILKLTLPGIEESNEDGTGLQFGGKQTLVIAHGSKNGVFEQHAAADRSAVLFDWESGGAESVSHWQKLAHAFSMIAAFGIVMPTGAFFPLLFRAKLGAPLWFKLHRGFQMAGALITVYGLFIIMTNMSAHMTDPHHILGLVLCILTILQPVNAYFRPHIIPKRPRSNKRKAWSLMHGIIGISIVFFGYLNCYLGTILLRPYYPNVSDPLLYSGFALFFIFSATCVYYLKRTLHFDLRRPVGGDKARYEQYDDPMSKHFSVSSGISHKSIEINRIKNVAKSPEPTKPKARLNSLDPADIPGPPPPESSPNSASARKQSLVKTGYDNPMAKKRVSAKKKKSTDRYEKMVDPASGATYYVNQRTGESTWTLPADAA